MKIVDCRVEKENSPFTVQNLEWGDIAQVTTGRWSGAFVLRGFRYLVNLSDQNDALIFDDRRELPEWECVKVNATLHIEWER